MTPTSFTKTTTLTIAIITLMASGQFGALLHSLAVLMGQNAFPGPFSVMEPKIAKTIPMSQMLNASHVLGTKVG